MGKELDVSKIPAWAWVLAALVVFGGGRAVASSKASSGGSNPGTGSTPGADTCQSAFNTRYYEGISTAELTTRAQAAIERANPSLKTNLRSWGGTGQPYSQLLAGFFVTNSQAFKVRLDVVMAIAHWETRGGFGDYVDVVRVQNSLNKSWNGKAWVCASGTELGPMQVKPCVFYDVDISMQAISASKSYPAAMLNWSIRAGVLYVRKLRDQYLAGKDWCDIIRAYNQGPTAFNNGFTAAQKKAADAYLAGVLAALPNYSELRNF